MRKQQEGPEQSEEGQNEALSEGGEAIVSKDSPEVAPDFDCGQDNPSGFPKPDDEDETKDFGMNMGM